LRLRIAHNALVFKSLIASKAQKLGDALPFYRVSDGKKIISVGANQPDYFASCGCKSFSFVVYDYLLSP
jgi:hypothetical protein